MSAVPVPGVPATTVTGYPVTVTGRGQTEYARLMPLVKWLLLLPHYIVLFFLGIGAGLVAFITFFTTIFTGSYPRPLWDFMVGVQRWSLRVLAYLLLMSDHYPAFSLSARTGDDIRLDAVYPERIERWRPLVAWLLVIPYAIIASLILTVAQICSVIAFFTIIFTRRMPDGIYPIMRAGLNWQTRANFYLCWLSTEYPPFHWEDE